jgi:IMP dehydrogenase
MASSDVEDEYHGGMAEWKTAAGVSTDVAYREDEDQIVADIVGGLRSGLTYGGAITIRELQRKLDYIHISTAAKTENMPHRLF